MRSFFRKTLIALIAVSLAAAGGLAPKHAQAKGQGGPHAAVSHHHDAGDGHAHHRAAMDAARSHDHGQPGVDPDKGAAPVEHDGIPIVNCCVASCAAIAHIFASIDLPDMPAGRAFCAFSPDTLAVAARTADDPPPR